MDNTENMALEVQHEPNDTQVAAVERIDTARAIGELKAQVYLARQFPRDLVKAANSIIQSCSRPYLADKAMYSYPRGGQTISGPSIRLAETIAQAFGNITFEVRVLERNIPGRYSDVEAYAWDMENNIRSARRFRVTHYRDTKKGRVPLRDERDIMEMEQNIGARYLRGCILRVIPIDIQESAIEQVRHTLAGDSTIPVADRVRKSLPEFSKLGVTPQMLEGYFGDKLDSLTEADLIELRGIFTALKDGVKKISDYFTRDNDIENAEATDELADAVRASNA